MSTAPSATARHHVSPGADDLSRRFFLPLLAFCAVVKCWLTWGRYISQDEFESIHQGWLIFEGFVPYRDFNSNHPPLGFAFLSLINGLTDSPVWIVRLARLVALLSSAFSIACIYGIARDTFGARAARWTIIVLAVNATFLEWSTEVRTDTLMLPLWLGSVWLLFSTRPVSLRARMVAIGLMMGTAFWVNQKVVLHAVPIGLFMLTGGPQKTWKLRHSMLAVAASLVPAACVLTTAASRGSFWALFDHNFAGDSAWGLFEDSTYSSWRNVTLKHTVLRDAGFVLLAQAAICWGRRQLSTRPQRFILNASLWMFLTLFITPGPFHYYMLSVLPLFAVLVGGYIDRLVCPEREGGHEATKRVRVWVPAAVAVLVSLPLLRLTKFIQPTNTYQFEVLDVAHQLLREGERGFDGSGSIVNRPDAYPYHWILWHPQIRAYQRGELPPLIPTLREHQCKWVVDTFRVRSLPEAERLELEHSFVPVWGPIRVSGYDTLDEIDSTPIEIFLWYDGVYQANRNDVLVDGHALDEPLELAAGKHTVSLPHGRGRVVLRNMSATQDVSLPAETIDSSYFLNVYGYMY